MAVTPSLKIDSNKNPSKKKVFQMILKSMGYSNLEDLIKRITFSNGTPDTELTGMHDYSLVWDYTNNIAYVHTTANTFVAIGKGLVFKDGFAMNRQSNPNG